MFWSCSGRVLETEPLKLAGVTRKKQRQVKDPARLNGLEYVAATAYFQCSEVWRLVLDRMCSAALACMELAGWV
jgi:hypothetical protein